MSSYFLNSEIETKQLAKKIAKHCSENERLVIFLIGELGVGKTTFTRFFLKALGYSGLVKSPTYTLFENYQLPKYHIFHLDLYRLHTPKEILEIGLYDEFDQTAIWLIEWPEHAFPFLPTPDIQCTFTLNAFNRQAELKSRTTAGRDLLLKIENL
ncbi:MAG: tRNA (adenosine(37)-N6)-threonylcarbamoyltransferase complex ATPase subunit type 1 TsaE [Rickettsiella sp.]|nr:tRNA (adenosine(37)-N6)-threonylcarbamoyltransferase complex ATPase subunit type 1 TsaE [Rickettsiella sp.]